MNAASVTTILISWIPLFVQIRQDYPEGHPYEGEQDPEGIMIAGGSLIMSPMGQLLAGPLRGSQG